MDIINQIEENFDVNSLVFRGIKIWPYLRHEIIYGYFYKKEESKDNEPVNLKTVLADYYYAYKSFQKGKKKIRQSLNLDLENEDTEIRKVPNLFLIRNGSRLTDVNQKKFNKFLEPYIDFIFPLLGESKIIEQISSTKFIYHRYSKSRMIDLEINKAMYLCNKKQLTQYLWGRYHKDAIQNYSKFLNFCKENHIKIFLNEYQLKNKLLQIWQLKKMWSKIFIEYQVQNIFIGNFDQLIYYAAILAAHELGINSIEVQHGMIGEKHWSYAMWNVVPNEGYEMLPTHYWCWGKMYAEIIDKWASKTTKHQSIIGGNLWLKDWKEENDYVKEITLEYDTSKLENIDKPLILFSAQPLETPDFIYEVIKNTQTQYQWLIRLHPGMLNDKGQYREMLLNKGITQFILQASQEMPLYLVLPKVKLNLTLSSTVSNEALAFGVLSIILNDYGKECFQEAIESNAFFYASNYKQLENMIQNFFANNLIYNAKYSERFFVTDTHILNKELSKLKNKLEANAA